MMSVVLGENKVWSVVLIEVGEVIIVDIVRTPECNVQEVTLLECVLKYLMFEK
jgi:hypothetical protein